MELGANKEDVKPDGLGRDVPSALGPALGISYGVGAESGVHLIIRALRSRHEFTEDDIRIAHRWWSGLTETQSLSALETWSRSIGWTVGDRRGEALR